MCRMAVKQISVFLENKPGQLAGIAKVLSDNGIDMRALTIAETAEFGIARIIADRPSDAAGSLRKAGYVCSLTDVLGVVIDDRPGGLYKVLNLLTERGINLEYAYAFTGRKADGAYNIFSVGEKDNERAAKILTENGVPIIAQEEIGEA